VLGRIPEEKTTATAMRIASAANVALGQAGAPPMSRCPVSSASSTARYSLRASRNQPSIVITRATSPMTSAQPPTIIPATSIVSAMEIRIGRNEGGGMWTPLGGLPAGAGSAPTVAAPPSAARTAS
jgi:hypothetical protein